MPHRGAMRKLIKQLEGVTNRKCLDDVTLCVNNAASFTQIIRPRKLFFVQGGRVSVWCGVINLLVSQKQVQKSVTSVALLPASPSADKLISILGAIDHAAILSLSEPALNWTAKVKVIFLCCHCKRLSYANIAGLFLIHTLRGLGGLSLVKSLWTLLFL